MFHTKCIINVQVTQLPQTRSEGFNSLRVRLYFGAAGIYTLSFLFNMEA